MLNSHLRVAALPDISVVPLVLNHPKYQISLLLQGHIPNTPDVPRTWSTFALPYWGLDLFLDRICLLHDPCIGQLGSNGLYLALIALGANQVLAFGKYLQYLAMI